MGSLNNNKNKTIFINFATDLDLISISTMMAIIGTVPSPLCPKNQQLYKGSLKYVHRKRLRNNPTKTSNKW